MWSILWQKTHTHTKKKSNQINIIRFNKKPSSWELTLMKANYSDNLFPSWLQGSVFDLSISGQMDSSPLVCRCSVHWSRWSALVSMCPFTFLRTPRQAHSPVTNPSGQQKPKCQHSQLHFSGSGNTIWHAEAWTLPGWHEIWSLNEMGQHKNRQ